MPSLESLYWENVKKANDKTASMISFSFITTPFPTSHIHATNMHITHDIYIRHDAISYGILHLPFYIDA